MSLKPPKFFDDRNMGFKLTVMFLLVILIPMTILAYVSYRVLDSYIVADAHDRMDTGLKVAWTDYYLRIEQMRYGMLQAASSEDVRQAVRKKDKVQLKKMMMQWKLRRPYVDIWTIVDKDSRVIVRLNVDDAGGKFDINGIIQGALLDGETRMSTEIIPKDVVRLEGHSFADKVRGAAPSRNGSSRAEEADEPVMALTVVVPVLDDGQRPIGAILTADVINNDNFIPDMVASKIPGLFTTISAQGWRITTNLSDSHGLSVRDSQVAKSVLDGLEGGKAYRGDIDVNGKVYSALFDPIRDNKDNIIGSFDVSMPKDAIWAIQRRNLTVIAVITALGLLLSLLAAFMSTRKITSPLNALKEKLDSFGRGDMTARVDVESEGATNDEIKLLARTYNTMMDDVRRRADEKERYLRVIEAMNKEFSEINEEFKIKNDELEVAYEEMQSQTEELHAINEELKLLNEDLDRKNTELITANRTISMEEQELRRAKDRLRLTYDSIKDYMLVIDYNHNIMETNKYFIDNFKLDEHQAVGRRVCGFFGLAEPLKECPVRKAIDCMAPVEHEMTLADGKVFMWHTYPLIDEDEKERKAVVYIKDITEQRLLMQKLIHSDKLSSLGELVSGVAHELNNPLTGIMVFSELLSEGEDLSADIRLKIKKINDASMRCKKIIENLLTFARWRKPEKKYENINNVIKESVELRDYQLRVGNVETVLDLDATVPRTMLDVTQIQQVFLNLINNAHDAITESGKGGRIMISSRCIDGRKIIVRVEDTGKGLSVDVAARIFDPFFTTKAVGKGTGLGLSISYGIIREHGGEIYALGRADGAVFVIELPVAGESQREASTGASSADTRERLKKLAAGKKALILDDEPVVLDVLNEYLNYFGFDVTRAEETRQAIKCVMENEYELIISDMKMPGLDGKDFYREVKAVKPEAVGRILFVTGDSVNTDTHRFLSSTGNKFLKKPFTIDQLNEVIMKLIA